MLVHRVRFGSSLDKELDDQLRKLHEETRIPISRLLDEAIEELLRKHKVLEKHSTNK
jgi:post-segregation antitoxin (ccd killing protein)